MIIALVIVGNPFEISLNWSLHFLRHIAHFLVGTEEFQIFLFDKCFACALWFGVPGRDQYNGKTIEVVIFLMEK